MQKRAWRQVMGLALSVWIVALANCSSSDAKPTNDCDPGATRVCTCTSGAAGSQLCSTSGFWTGCTCDVCPVTPTCDGKACGDNDGCGKACLVGSCPTGQKCVSGACSDKPCTPDCDTKACGDANGCGGVCTSAPCAKPGFLCNAGKCECKPVCTTCGGDDTCGGKCSTGACSAGFRCTGGTCGVDPTSRWVITVTTGSITTDGGWNTLSKPDPMVCLTMGSGRTCTQDAADTLSPSWGCAFPAVDAATLLAGIVVETFDNDRSTAGVCAEKIPALAGDAICAAGTVKLTDKEFTSKAWTVACGTTMTFHATLTPL